MNNETIVTFCCNNMIHVYGKDCGVYPRSPYKVHSSIEDAKKYLTERNKNENEIKVRYA